MTATRARSVLAAAALATSLTAPPAPADDAREVRQQVFERTNAGLRALRAGNGRQAAIDLCWAADRLLNSHDAAWFCGRARLAAHQPDRAIRYLELAAELNPRHLSTWVDLGDAYLAAGRPGDARGAYFKALEIRKDHSPAYDGLARLATALGRERQALEMFEKALAANPADAVARLHRGQLHLAAGRVDQALVDIEEAARLRPDDGAVQLGLAQVTARAGLDQRALSAARRAAEIMPEDPRPPALLARLLLEAGARGEAEQQARRAVALDPEMPEARLALAEVLGRTGRLDEAIDLLSEPPAAWWSERERAALEAARTRWSARREALARLESVAASASATPADLLTLAEAELAVGREERASALALRAAEGADDAQVLRRAAFILGNAGRPLEAERTLAPLVESGAATPLDLVNIGVARELSGDPDGAEAAFVEALADAAAGEVACAAHAGLARLALRRGDRDEAKSQLLALLAASPPEQEALRAQAAIDALEAAAGSDAR